MGMVQGLQQMQLVEHHLLVAANIALQDDLHGDTAVGGIGFPDHAISAGTQGAAKPVL